jgi:hypothetical protein
VGYHPVLREALDVFQTWVISVANLKEALLILISESVIKWMNLAQKGYANTMYINSTRLAVVYCHPSFILHTTVDKRT